MKALSTVLSITVLGGLSFAPVMAADIAVSAPGTMMDSQVADASLNGGCGARRVHKSYRRINSVANNTSTVTRTETINQPAVLPDNTVSQQIAQPAMVSGSSCGPAVITAAPCAQPCPQVLTQPAVTEVAPSCGINPAALLGAALLGAGIATAIELPLTLHHHHHHNRGTNLSNEQLLLFAAQSRTPAPLPFPYIPGFGFGTVVPGVGFVPAPFPITL